MVSESNFGKKQTKLPWQGHKVVVTVNFPKETAYRRRERKYFKYSKPAN
jgi:hypothetical protein